MRGVMQYANAERKWEFFTSIRRTFEESLSHWPECDGAIIAGAQPAFIENVRGKCRHMIVCSGAAGPSEPAVVRVDDEAVGRMAAEHLIECGLKSFGYYGWGVNDLVGTGGTGFDRRHGFELAVQKAGFPCACYSASFGRETETNDWSNLIAWLRGLARPVGILTVDDGAAHNLASACRHAGLGVPEHVAIIGVNNDDLLCEAISTPLSSVDCGYSRLGHAAAYMLDRLLRGERLSNEERHLRIPPLRVVKRLSTDVLAVDDPHVADALRYIREHACDPCSVDDVLLQVSVGRRRLERLFARKLGYSPATEIVRVQIETAKQLLSRPEFKLAEVSHRCGFANPPSFTRAFTRVVGVTPSGYRSGVVPPS